MDQQIHAAKEGDRDRKVAHRSRICCKDCTFDYSRKEYWEEMKGIMHFAWPIILYLVMQYMLGFVSIAFCGRLGRTELAAASLATSLIGIVMRGFAIGFSSVLETLFSQTYGSVNKKQVGVVLQRGLLFMTILCIIISSIMLNAENILLIFGQDAHVAYLVEDYLTIFILAIPAECFGIVFVKYLQCQGILLPVVLLLLITNVLNFAFHYLFLFVFNFGLRGSPLSLVLADYCLLGMLIGYIKFRKLYKETWAGWSWESLEDWWTFFKLGIAGALMLSFELWSFEVGFFLAGLIGQDAIAVQTIVLFIAGFTYMLPLGIAIAATVRLGNNLGANKPRSARLTAIVALFGAWISTFFESVIVLALHPYLGYIFTNDSEIVEAAASILLIFPFFFAWDNTAGVCSGIVRGSGRQLLGAVINLIGFYIVGLPLGISLMFAAGLGNAGYWIGQTIGLFAQAIMYLFFVSNLNWTTETKLALRRAGVMYDLAPEENDLQVTVKSNGLVLQDVFTSTASLEKDEKNEEETAITSQDGLRNGEVKKDDLENHRGDEERNEVMEADKTRKRNINKEIEETGLGTKEEKEDFIGRGKDSIPNNISQSVEDDNGDVSKTGTGVEIKTSKRPSVKMLLKRVGVLLFSVIVLFVAVICRLTVEHGRAYNPSQETDITYIVEMNETRYGLLE